MSGWGSLFEDGTVRMDLHAGCETFEREGDGCPHRQKDGDKQPCNHKKDHKGECYYVKNLETETSYQRGSRGMGWQT